MKTLAAARFALLILCFALPISSSMAGELSAVINGKSFHLGASEDWNEDNYGLGLEYEFASQSRWKSRLMANGFRDSSDDMSYMAGGGLHRNLFATDRLRGFYVDAGINAFLMTRKDVNDNKPFPGIVPSLTVGNQYAGINLTYLPRQAVEKFYDTQMTDESMSGILFLQFKVNFGPRSGAD
ncbi:MAG: hypothetical protein OEU90_07775 [Gammaproteobacteria bacterium]|jgi:hypothetical protein|nr:hypothetical protein [Gammaproteobacteria bacterium]MDH3805354.1 hypothetical protein [Gammaproteobacteria bacterium]